MAKETQKRKIMAWKKETNREEKSWQRETNLNSKAVDLKQ